MPQVSGVVDAGALQLGRFVKSVAGSSNVTLSQAEYENGNIEFTEALTGNISVFLPLLDGREWSLKNSTTGAFTLTAIGASGTGVVLPQGAETRVRTDGTNVARISLDTRAAGGFVVQDKGTVSATAGAATLSQQAGVVTSEALTTAAGADYTLTLTNTLVAATSIVFVSLATGTNTIAPIYVSKVTPGSGSVVIVVRNGHASSALDGTIKISFLVLP